MHLTTATAIVLSLTSTSLASLAGVINHCNQNIYLVVSNTTVAAAPITLGPNGTYNQPLAGHGNQFGISKLADYYNTNTPKLTFGFSDATDSHLTYWSVGTVNGDPFAGNVGGSGFVVATSDPTCPKTTAYDGKVNTCKDTVRDLRILKC